VGWRWRKVFRTGPVTTTVTTKDIGWSIGIRGLRYGISPTGRRYISVGVPSTGLYWTNYLDGDSTTKTWRRINMEQTPFGPERISLAENAEPRCATVLLLDVSSSMQGRPIAELQEAVKIYRDQVSADDLAKKRVEIAVVTFGGSVDIAHGFAEAEFFQLPALNASGDTPMAQAVLTGLRLLEERKQEYRQHGLGLFRPWVFLLTDGAFEPGAR
jgi:Mg-chelatase subunit ChlD